VTNSTGGTYDMSNRSRTSDQKGVHWCTRRNKWISYGYHKLRCIYLGQYDTEEEAIEARLACDKNPPEKKKIEIDASNMQTCRSFTRCDDDY